MSHLVLPFSPGFTWSADNLEGATLTSGTPGETVVSGGSANTDGTEDVLLTALAKDACYLVLELNCANTSTAIDANRQVDILIDPAGGTSYSSFIDDILLGYSAQNGLGPQLRLCFPVWIPAGASLGVRSRAVAVSVASSVVAYVWGEPRHPEMWWCGSGVETLGSVAASSKGTDFTPGTSNSWGSWTTVGSSTKRYGAVQFGCSGPATTTLNAGSYTVEWGVGSTMLPGSWRHRLSSHSPNEYMTRGSISAPIWCDVASGTTWQVRGNCNTSPAQDLNAVVHGVY